MSATVHKLVAKHTDEGVWEAPWLPSVQRVAHIQRIVAQAYGLHPRLMSVNCRRRGVSRPRQVAMYLAREMTGKSYPALGKIFGGLDHSTVIYAIQAVEARMMSVPFYREDVEALRARCAG